MSKLSADEIGFLEVVSRKRREESEEILQNKKRVVGAFGIEIGRGEQVIIPWVRSSLARKIVEDKPEPRSEWMNYQLQTMFAGWYEETATADTSEVPEEG